MFRKMTIAVVLALGMATSFAAQTILDTSGLSDAQVAGLKAHAAKVVAEAANQAAGTTVSTATPGAVMTIAATWGQQAASAAEGFARALGIAAKELGVTVNDFLHTDAGKLTAALIIWKVAGAAFIHMLYGMLFITVGLTIVRVIYMRLFTKGYEQVGYSYFGGFFKGTKLVRVPKSFQDMHNDGEWLAFWVMIGVTMVTIGIGGTFF